MGKSTLINALTHSGLVHTSPKPGTTRTINWFSLGDRLMLVDLPGYGFAFADEKDVDTWQQLVSSILILLSIQTKEYLSNRPTLKRIVLLLGITTIVHYSLSDARHGVKQADIEMMKLLNSAHASFQIALTKCDLLTQKQLAEIGTMMSSGPTRQFHHCVQQLLMVSARTHAGLSVLRKELFAQVEHSEDKKS